MPADKGEIVKITDARVIVSSPGRNYVTLIIETEDGLLGVGDATLNGRELADQIRGGNQQDGE